jgi:hypothetical protein
MDNRDVPLCGNHCLGDVRWKRSRNIVAITSRRGGDRAWRARVRSVRARGHAVSRTPFVLDGDRSRLAASAVTGTSAACHAIGARAWSAASHEHAIEYCA